MLPPAMSVRCTMTCPPMRTPLGERDCCFFVVRRVSRGNLELTLGHFGDGGAEAQAIALCKCVVRSIIRSTSIRGRIPPRHRLAVRHLVDFLYQRALKAAAHSVMPRGLDPLFIALNRSANAATTISRSRSGA